jgi:hypothetical protein
MAGMLCSTLFSLSCYAGNEKMIIDGKNGEKIVVNNFASAAKKIAGDVELIDNDKMSISYGAMIDIHTNKESKCFNISIGGRNLKEVQQNQKKAEAFMLKILGISKTEACKLKVQISAPKSMTGSYGYDLQDEFSFCPTGALINRI